MKILITLLVMGVVWAMVTSEVNAQGIVGAGQNTGLNFQNKVLGASVPSTQPNWPAIDWTNPGFEGNFRPLSFGGPIIQPFDGQGLVKGMIPIRFHVQDRNVRFKIQVDGWDGYRRVYIPRPGSSQVVWNARGIATGWYRISFVNNTPVRWGSRLVIFPLAIQQVYVYLW